MSKLLGRAMTDRLAEKNMEELNKAWVLFKSLQDKEKFNALTLDEKLEALRIAAIQERGDE